jgi:hypothetical protein
MAKPNYTDKELQDILDNNNKGVMLPNGKHLTMYQMTQWQRQQELEIRKSKDGWIVAKEAGDTDLMAEYKARASQLSNEYKAFCKEYGLDVRKDRTSVSGYLKYS